MSKSALLATAFGASSTRWRSYVCGVIRLNGFRFTRELSGYITLAIIVCQSSGCSTQPRLYYVSWVLLMYIHNVLSSFIISVLPVAFTTGCCGVVVGGVFCSIICVVLCVSVMVCLFWVCVCFCIFCLIYFIMVFGVGTVEGVVVGVNC